MKANITDHFSKDEIFDKAMEQLEAIDDFYISSIYDTNFQFPSFLKIISEKNLTNIVRKLIGNKFTPLYGNTDRCRIDPPQYERRTYGWHQEVFYTIPRGRYIQSWAPLIRDTTIENGTIKVPVGSHKEGVANQTWNEID